MFKAMGQKDREIELYDDALVKLSSTGGKDKAGDEKIGGFSKRHIENLEPRTLKLLLKLLVAKGRALINYSHTEYSCHIRGASVFMDAMAIFEQAPASRRLKDRSVLFPCYSSLYQQLKAMAITVGDCNRGNLEVEQRLSKLFMSDSKVLALSHCRALALHSQVKGRLGDYVDANRSVEVMRSIYSPELHSELIVTDYATDKCAQAIAETSFWHLSLGDVERAQQVCNEVIDGTIPQMYQESSNSFCLVLMPLLAVYQHLDWPEGKAALCLKLFQKFVIDVFYAFEGKHGQSPCSQLFKPVPLLLRLLSTCGEDSLDDDMESDIKWALEEFDNEDEFFNAIDCIYGNTCWSPKTAVAEICYLLAVRLEARPNASIETQKSLVERGIAIASTSAMNMQTTKNRIPLVLERNQKIRKLLQDLALTGGVTDCIQNEYDATETMDEMFKEGMKTECIRLSRYLTPEAEEDF